MRPEFDLASETNTQLLAHFGAHDSGLGFFADGVVGVIHNQATLLQCVWAAQIRAVGALQLNTGRFKQRILGVAGLAIKGDTALFFV